jgi:hypothetical protein
LQMVLDSLIIVRPWEEMKWAYAERREDIGPCMHISKDSFSPQGKEDKGKRR